MFLLVLFFAPKKRTDWGVGVSPTNGLGELSKKLLWFFLRRKNNVGGAPTNKGLRISHFSHPSSDRLPYALLKGKAEGAVAAVATFVGQLLGDDGLSGSGKLLVALDEVVDALIVDIGIIGDALTGEILAEIVTVGANGLCQLLQGQVMLQVELGGDAVLAQQLFYLGEVDRGGRGRRLLCLDGSGVFQPG